MNFFINDSLVSYGQVNLIRRKNISWQTTFKNNLQSLMEVFWGMLFLTVELLGQLAGAQCTLLSTNQKASYLPAGVAAEGHQAILGTVFPD